MEKVYILNFYFLFTLPLITNEIECVGKGGEGGTMEARLKCDRGRRWWGRKCQEDRNNLLEKIGIGSTMIQKFVMEYPAYRRLLNRSTCADSSTTYW